MRKKRLKIAHNKFTEVICFVCSVVLFVLLLLSVVVFSVVVAVHGLNIYLRVFLLHLVDTLNKRACQRQTNNIPTEIDAESNQVVFVG